MAACFSFANNCDPLPPIKTLFKNVGGVHLKYTEKELKTIKVLEKNITYQNYVSKIRNEDALTLLGIPMETARSLKGAHSECGSGLII